MFEPTTNAIVVALFNFCSVQIFFSNQQMNRNNKRTMQIRRHGALIAIGVDGNKYRRKVYVPVVIDDGGKVVAAESLSGLTVLATAKPVANVQGRVVWEIGRGQAPEGIPSKTWAAIDHAAGFLRKKVDPIRAAAMERDSEEVG